jgi:predicted ribosomally synthesized peptide with nif11-like leader
MKEELKLFIKKALEDVELQEKMQACHSPEEAYAVASSVQEGFTFEEFVDAMRILNDFANQNEDLELSDEDLAMAAGGLDTIDIVSGIVASVSASVSFAVAAF